MALKVISGLIGPGLNEVGKEVPNARALQHETPSQQAVRLSTTNPQVLNEAVVSTVRTTAKGAVVSDKIKTPEEAKEIAHKVSEKIRGGESSLEAHTGLDDLAASGLAKEYLL